MLSPLTSAINPRRGPHSRQRGSIVAVTAIGMVALLAMAGLALDGGHMLLNKTRLQNAVDAAVLSAAKSLSLGEDVTTATTDAIATFVLNANATGNPEMADAYALDKINVIVEYSDSINPFTPDATLTDPAFVRVSVNSFPLPVWLSQIVGFTDKRVRASAVAGESPVLEAEACDITPIMACGDKNPTDGSYHGYQPGEITVLKLGAGDETTQGPGNAQIIAIDGDSGGSVYREAAAGGYEQCATVSDDAADSGVETEPGVKVGPTVQGFNLRMGGTSGPLDPEVYPADTNIIYAQEPNGDGIIADIVVIDDVTYIHDKNGAVIDPIRIYTYNDYESSGMGNGRRVLTIPIGKCDPTAGGRKAVEVYGFGCFFMLQPVIQNGTDSQLFGQFDEKCSAEGGFLQNPTATETGPTRLILYKDSASGDS